LYPSLQTSAGLVLSPDLRLEGKIKNIYSFALFFVLINLFVGRNKTKHFFLVIDCLLLVLIFSSHFFIYLYTAYIIIMCKMYFTFTLLFDRIFDYCFDTNQSFWQISGLGKCYHKFFCLLLFKSNWWQILWVFVMSTKINARIYCYLRERTTIFDGF